ncbi:MAG: serine hydrolase domain-containing protein [Candidatus Hodarchaeota archaeon]
MKENIKIPGIQFFFSICFCLLFSFLVSAQTNHASRFSKQVDHFLKERITESAPGAAVIITEKGNPIFKECYGLANVEHDISITFKTVFNLASVSKQFTAFAILLLESEGKLHIDDDIHTYLPELPDYGNSVSIRHLLNHTSGIWEYWTAMHTYAGYRRYDYFTKNEVIELIKHQDKLLFEPGSQWFYCNTNYLLLAEIVSRITGESFTSWTRKNIFEPLGMKDSFFHENSFQLFKYRASPYREDDNGRFIEDPDNRNNYAGHGYLYTTIDDMMLWMDNFRTKKLGGNEVVDRMFEKGKLNNGSENFYGFGLGILNRHEKKVIEHSGQTGGYKAFMLYCPENEVGITILANEHSFDVEGIGEKIFGLYLGITPAEKEKTQTEKRSYFTIDSSRVEDYVGMFLIEETSSRLAFCHIGENTFYGILEGLGQDKFYPVSDMKFINRYENVSVTFVSDENNQFDRIELDLKGEIMQARRIEFERISSSRLAQNYAGFYYSNAMGTVYEIKNDNHKLIMRHRRYDDRKFHQVSVDEFVSGYGIMRFKKDENGRIKGLEILDEYFNYNPIYFQKIED